MKIKSKLLRFFYKPIKNIESIKRQISDYHRVDNLLLKELLWAHKYHDLIRGEKIIEDLSIKFGRWAGSYPLFYILYIAINEFEIAKILEFGVGETTKFISILIDNKHNITNHLALEHDDIWLENFKKNNYVSKKSNLLLKKIDTLIVNDKEVKSYSNLNFEKLSNNDLFIVDGPYGSKYISRYEIVQIAKFFKDDKRFIIIIDDFDRMGEKKTFQLLLENLKGSNISFYDFYFNGEKDIAVVVSKHFSHLKTLGNTSFKIF